MDTCRVVELIETTLTRRGDGKTDPIRVITQYWTVDGQLLFEIDPIDRSEQASRDDM
ncbi:hypothetical protein D3C75_724820 [compost metagenome]